MMKKGRGTHTLPPSLIHVPPAAPTLRPAARISEARSDCAPVTHSPTLTHSLNQSLLIHVSHSGSGGPDSVPGVSGGLGCFSAVGTQLPSLPLSLSLSRYRLQSPSIVHGAWPGLAYPGAGSVGCTYPLLFYSGPDPVASSGPRVPTD